MILSCFMCRFGSWTVSHSIIWFYVKVCMLSSFSRSYPGYSSGYFCYYLLVPTCILLDNVTTLLVLRLLKDEIGYFNFQILKVLNLNPWIHSVNFCVHILTSSGTVCWWDYRLQFALNLSLSLGACQIWFRKIFKRSNNVCMSCIMHL